MQEEQAQRLRPDVLAEARGLHRVDDLVDKEAILTVLRGRLEFGLELILHVTADANLSGLIKSGMWITAIQLLEVTNN